MADREKVIRIIDELIFEAQKAPTWKAENALRCLKKELLKEQEAVEPIPFFTKTGEESKNYVVCGHCKSINSIMPKTTKQKYCHECGHPVLWEGH